ncbi:MAG: tetratricopeptide repeat protein [Achromobacter sp.]|nr:tetratricopeptide repeat protein [Achromobacter sp.]
MTQNWNPSIHTLWQSGNRSRAMSEISAKLSKTPGKKPLGLAMQFVHYLTLLHEWHVSLAVLEDLGKQWPDQAMVKRNIALSAFKTGDSARAVTAIHECLAITPHDHVALDILTMIQYSQKRYEDAAASGTASLQQKAMVGAAINRGWTLPKEAPSRWLEGTSKRDVIAFSLWGKEPRYLRGAFDNIEAARALYPTWQVRFYADSSVPAPVLADLKLLGAQVVTKPSGQTLQNKLTWRFEVADDADVARFLVRDVDSVLTPRERAAVDAWIASDRWFHVMRDWWVHAELVLAGMWGGVAGVLPSVRKLRDKYTPGLYAAAHVDQDFLRDRIWPYLSTSCLVHDRCFAMDGVEAWPTPAPPGDDHVGINVFAADQHAQAERVATFLRAEIGNKPVSLPLLGLEA